MCIATSPSAMRSAGKLLQTFSQNTLLSPKLSWHEEALGVPSTCSLQLMSSLLWRQQRDCCKQQVQAEANPAE